MGKKVIRLAHISRRAVARSLDAEAGRLLNGYKRLSKGERQTLLTLLDAFLACKRPAGGHGNNGRPFESTL